MKQKCTDFCTSLLKLFFLQIIFFSTQSVAGNLEGQDLSSSQWVFYGADGKLQYKTTEKGDRILDFSHAGYMGGGVAIPDFPVKVTVYPSGEDDTEQIQAAIDKVSQMSQSGSFRGAVLLAPGTYTISKTIEIRESGVVLRGSGSGMYGNIRSTLRLTGNPFNAISVSSPRQTGRNTAQDQQVELQVDITGDYVPSGATSLNVSDAGKFRAGDLISIEKQVTGEWVEFMQMHNLVRDGNGQTWLETGSTLSAERQISGISGNTIFFDVPLSDSYNAKFLASSGAVVKKLPATKRISQSGIENLHIVSPAQAASHEQRHFTALRINGEDCWARNMLIEETMNSVAVGGKRITLQFITISRKAMHQGSSRPAEIAPNGSQVLVDRCNVNADNVWFIATGARNSGPIVILNCNFTGDQRAESHQRWSTGLLYDNVRADNGGIDLRNRGSMGSGHGWSMGWGVAWNCVAKNYVIQNPPGACNWMIGCIGENLLMPRPFDKEPLLEGGVVDAHGTPVNPVSLYLAQLKERLGEQALKNIGY